ncbi:MAG: hypothetical protein LBI67_11985 [Treponema sp.]|jgi:hypothetical protein|nr:hypothetical protein [Treponema sp.]
MKAVTQQAIGTTEEWENENPLLDEAVFGVEITEDGNRYFKLGDGVHLWNDLSYLDKHMLKGLAEELGHIVNDVVPGNDTPEMDGAGYAGDPGNLNYSRSDHRHPGDTGKADRLGENAYRKSMISNPLNGGGVVISVESKMTQGYGDLETVEDNFGNNFTEGAPGAAPSGRVIGASYQTNEGKKTRVALTDGELQIQKPGEVFKPLARQEAVAKIQQTVDSWIGLGGYLTDYDFGTAVPEQEDITAYALTQITDITDPVQIWNGTKVRNTFDNHLWILTNTQNTDPVIFEWTDQGVSDLTLQFGNGSGGYIIGKEDVPGNEGYVGATPEGYGKVNGWNELLDKLFSLEHPAGSLFEQKPSDLSPPDRNWPGTWEVWSYRASLYGISEEAPAPEFIADWKTYRHNIWSLNTDGSVASAGTKKYTKPADFVCVERKDVHGNVWTDTDLAEGALITSGDYEGMYIWQAMALAGVFFGVEDSEYEGGGNRPTFISGGAQGDRIRNITGTFNTNNSAGFIGDGKLFVAAGAAVVWVGGSQYLANNTIYFNTGMIVPAGPDNAPSNLSVRFWRRIS